MKTDAEKLTALSDVQLIECFMQGTNRAFDVLMIRHSPHLKIFLDRLLHDEEQIKDTLQTIWVHVLEAIRKRHYQENGQFEKWLNKITFNIAMNTKKDRKTLRLWVR